MSRLTRHPIRRALRASPAPALVCLLALSATGQAHGSRPLTWHPHIAAARRDANRRAGAVAFAVIAQRGRVSGYRMASTAPAASVFKVMLLVAFLRIRDHRGLSSRDRPCWPR
jgi:beta-lactamase class A